MAQSLAHRGPDGRGILVEGRVGLAHTRLAVIDREGGAQPFSNPARGTTIVYNGEVFNHIELRRELESDGRVFSTKSDTEVVLAAYETWGDDAWRRFEGQFALALWDRFARSMYLVRDRAGICPLFVARLPNALIFASEAKAIFASGRAAPRVDRIAINAVFRNWSVPGTRSVFEGVESVAPGQRVRISLDAIGSPVWRRERQDPLSEGSRSVVGRIYARLRDGTDSQDFPVESNNSRESFSSEARVTERLRRAVERRLRSDIPVGAYLSGGLDSSLLTALIVEERARAGSSPPTTFSIRFRGEGDFDRGFDEGAAQHMVAQALGTDHREISVGTDRLVESLERTIDHTESPLLRAGPIPMLLLSEFVREQGMRVVLTGEGADELFGGYDIFKEARLRAYLARDPASGMRQALASRLHRQHATRTDGGIAMWSAFLSSGEVHAHRRDSSAYPRDSSAYPREDGQGHALQRSGSGDTDPFASHVLRWQSGAWMVRFLSEDIRASLDQQAFYRCVESAMPPAWRDLDDLGRAQELEIASFMVPYLLSSQGDRMLMANGVEGRYPFLDGAVAAEAARLRSEERLVGLREKPLLRRIAGRLLPREIAERPKWPYRSPMQRAFFGVDAPDFVREALSDTRLRAHPLIDGPAAARLAQRAFMASATKPLSEREEMAAFGLLTLVLWHERFVEHASCANAVDQRESEISIFKHDACACSEECVACSEDER